jgi:HSP20 family molecular chaperone IbpA
MSTLPLTPFDILSRNFFKADEAFAPALNSKQPHPLNIFHDDQGLYFEIACTGLTKKDIKIDIEGNEIKIHYLKKEPEEQLSEGYIYHGLSKKSFSLGYKIAPKFNVDLTDAKLEHGLLIISIPIAENARKKTIPIN